VTGFCEPPPSYRKKLINQGGGCPLIRTYTEAQVSRRIAFYEELNDKRKQLPKEGNPVERRYILRGWEETTTVRVYMRETVSRIARELFWSVSRVSVENLNEKGDKDRGCAVLSVRATKPEIDALLEYIRPEAAFYVYDGEEGKYLAGDTERSEFIIVKVDDPVQPAAFWRRSQSFIAAVEEV
jgi:hypothetical protein